MPNHYIERNDIAFAENAAKRRYAVDDFFVNRDASMRRIAARTVLITETGAASAKTGDPIAARFLQILRSDTGPDKWLELIKHRGGDGTGLAHFRDADFVFDRNHAASAAPSITRRPKVR